MPRLPKFPPFRRMSLPVRAAQSVLRDGAILLYALIAVALLNALGQVFYFRADLTGDKRYTLSPATRAMLDTLPSTLYVRTYLGGDLPLEFARLRSSLQEMLEEYSVASHHRVQFLHEDPNAIADERERAHFHDQLIRDGITPISTQERSKDGSLTERLVFPALTMSYAGRTAQAHLYHERITLSAADNVDLAIQSLEHTLTTALARLLRSQKPSLVFLHGHDELSENETADWAKTLSDDFEVSHHTLTPQVGSLDGYNVAIVANPTRPYTEGEKLVLDQYLMRGGCLLFMVSPVSVGLDTLQRGSETLAYPVDHNLGDLFFRWGVRLSPHLLQDMQCAPVPINTALAGQPARFTPMPWLYFPLLTPGPRSLISRNVNLVYSHFPSPIELTQGVDTLRGQVLLTTSAHARALSVPRLINLEEVRQPISPQHMNLSYVPVGITLEGRFSSLYAHRPVSTIAGGQQFEFRERGPAARMAIIADGSIARNDVRVRGAQTQVLPLGFDRFTQQTFGNKELLSNVAFYLAGFDDLLSLRGREVRVRILNQETIVQHRQRWQILNLLLPSILLLLVGAAWQLLRWWRYAR